MGEGNTRQVRDRLRLVDIWDYITGGCMGEGTGWIQIEACR